MVLLLHDWAVTGLKCQRLSVSAPSALLLGSLHCTGHPWRQCTHCDEKLLVKKGHHLTAA